MSERDVKPTVSSHVALLLQFCCVHVVQTKFMLHFYVLSGESASFLSKSTYIRDLATLVIGYGMAINIVEVTWKSKLKAAFPDPNSYSMFMGNFSTMTGIVTLLMMLGGTCMISDAVSLVLAGQSVTNTGCDLHGSRSHAEPAYSVGTCFRLCTIDSAFDALTLPTHCYLLFLF